MFIIYFLQAITLKSKLSYKQPEPRTLHPVVLRTHDFLLWVKCDDHYAMTPPSSYLTLVHMYYVTKAYKNGNLFDCVKMKNVAN
jgi:hypothetical protein